MTVTGIEEVDIPTDETLESEETTMEEETSPVVEPEPVTVVDKLVIKYGNKTAVSGISFHIQGGEALGILGDNGAGKSSTMRALSTVAPPTEGTILTAGHNLSEMRGSEAARELTGYCPDVGGLVRSATPREHIGLTLSLHRKTHLWDNAINLLNRLDLTRVIDEPTSGFSHGMSRRLSVVLAALASDKLLILDEPFDGVDPLGVDATIDLINEAKDAGLAVVLSTHLQEVLVRATDRVIVMASGTIIDEGPSSEFKGKKGQKRYYDSLMAFRATQEAHVPA